MAHVDLTSNDNEDSNSQGVKEVERVKKTTDIINHQMVNVQYQDKTPFRYKEQELINISTDRRAASIDLMRAHEKDSKHWLQQEKQKK